MGSRGLCFLALLRLPLAAAHTTAAVPLPGLAEASADTCPRPSQESLLIQMQKSHSKVGSSARVEKQASGMNGARAGGASSRTGDGVFPDVRWVTDWDCDGDSVNECGEWDYSKAMCKNQDFCGHQYHAGDWTLDRSCRCRRCSNPLTFGRAHNNQDFFSGLDGPLNATYWGRWQTWADHHETCAPWMMPQDDDGIRRLLRYAQNMGYKVRISGAAHSAGGLVTDGEDANTFVISLGEYTAPGEWEFALHDAPDGTKRATVNAGWTQLQLYAKIRPLGYFLPAQTAGYFFALGGIVANSVHGGAYAEGFIHGYVTKMRVMYFDGSIRVLDAEEDLRYWRNSFGLLGIILGVEFRLVPRETLDMYSQVRQLDAWTEEEFWRFIKVDAEADVPPEAAGSNHYRKAQGVGEWGGLCTCPDGQVYEVGDNHDSCSSLACEGGVAGACTQGGISAANASMKVTCGYAAGGHGSRKSWNGEFFVDFLNGGSRPTMSVYAQKANESATTGIPANCAANYQDILNEKVLDDTHGWINYGASARHSGAPPEQVPLLGGDLDQLLEDLKWLQLSCMMSDQAIKQIPSIVQRMADLVNDGFFLRTSPAALAMAYFVEPHRAFEAMDYLRKKQLDSMQNVMTDRFVWNLPGEFRFVKVQDKAVLQPVPAGLWFNAQPISLPALTGNQHSWMVEFQDVERFYVEELKGKPHMGKLWGFETRPTGEVEPFSEKFACTIYSEEQKSSFEAYRANADPVGLFASGLGMKLLAKCDGPNWERHVQ